LTDTLTIRVRDSFEPIMVEADFVAFINDLNIAAATGKQYVIATEANTGGQPVALETRNITAIRPAGSNEDAFIGGD
jgi:hypothetical protein